MDLEQLEKLNELKKKGAITQEEFEEKKKKLQKGLEIEPISAKVSLWWCLIPPVYLYKRAKLLDEDLTKCWVSIIVLVIAILVILLAVFSESMGDGGTGKKGWRGGNEDFYSSFYDN